MGELECRLEELGELFLVAMGQSSSEAGTWESGGDDEDNQAGGEGSGGAGVSIGEYEAADQTGYSGAKEAWSDQGDGGGEGGWAWGMVQQDGPGVTGELEWARLQHVQVIGVSQDNSPDNYWWPNLA